jgi:restriction system protein
MSVEVKKQDFLALNLAQVDLKACFRNLKGISGSRLADLSPVRPILTLNKEDPRFVSAHGVVGSLDQGTNLAAMDWLDFENLIRELFEKEISKNGGEVKITGASRDGGVDAIAFDPDPIRGGKIVIQAKRYTNIVGVSAVRDLYGTVHNEGATKGILVTTSDYGPDSYEFAKDKPLTLLSGGELLYLLGKHGIHAKINIKEAKKILGETDV